MRDLPRLYTELADWWPLLSPPEDYAEEAEFYRQTFDAASGDTIRTMLELGSGGGNNASHLKKHYEMTLVDLSPAMLEVSRRLNPECEHLQGDMRDVDLDREFDAVFIHDAIDFLATEEDLAKTMQTAYRHLKPGGVAMFVPDHTLESYAPGTRHGGIDDGPRGLRYLEWDWPADPATESYTSVMTYVIREADQSTSCVEDKTTYRLFSKATWLDCMDNAGFVPRVVPLSFADEEVTTATVFVATKAPPSGQ